MDRSRFRVEQKLGGLVLALVCAWQPASEAVAERPTRMVYNPVTKQTEPEQRRQPATAAAPRQVQQRAQASQPQPAQAAQPIEQVSYTAACDCGGVGCDSGCCGDPVCGDPICGGIVGCGGAVACGPSSPMYAGFEFTFVKPRFESNLAFITNDSDGGGVNNAINDTVSETEFDYDLELTPRVYVGWCSCDGIGFRATWWHFDHESAAATGAHPGGGFGTIVHPDFAPVNIGTTQAGEQFTAASSLNAYTIDLEGTRDTSFCGWDLGVAGGIRYAFAEQRYLAQLNDANNLLGTIDYLHSIEGIGPTISLNFSRPLTQRLSVFSKARGSVLFGDGEARLQGGEDLNQTPQMNTTRTSARDDLLSIAEAQLGLRWQGRPMAGRVYTPFLGLAMEGQVWHGAGNASSEEGSLGFFGFVANVGFDW